MKLDRKLAVAAAAVLAIGVAAPAVGQADLEGPFGTLPYPAPPSFDDEAQAATEVRRQTMATMSGHFRALDAILRGEAAASDELVIMHARGLEALAAQLHEVFEVESPAEEGGLGATQRIWDEPELFAQHVGAFQTSTRELVEAVETDTDVHDAFVGMRYYCLACHEEFRLR